MQKDRSQLEADLEVGDILLFHSRFGPVSRSIQHRTDSYWSHSVLVFAPAKDLPLGGTLIVEAMPGGIEMHHLKKYLGRPDRYDIGVKRFPGLAREERERIVRNFMIDNIDAPYDLSRVFWMYALFWLQSLLPLDRRRELVRKAIGNSNRFICSTFVHKAFHALAGHHAGRAEEEIYVPGDVAKDPMFEWIHNPRD